MERFRHNKFFYVFLCCVILLTTLVFGCGGPSATGDQNSDQQQQTTTDVNSEGNQAPIIDAVISEWSAVERGKATKIQVIAHDPDGDKLTYSWSCQRGSLSPKTGTMVSYTAPNGYMDDNEIVVSASDGHGGSQYSSVNIRVVCCSLATKNPDWKP